MVRKAGKRKADWTSPFAQNRQMRHACNTSTQRKQVIFRHLLKPSFAAAIDHVHNPCFAPIAEQDSPPRKDHLLALRAGMRCVLVCAACWYLLDRRATSNFDLKAEPAP
jgi:hypothetical protein